MLSYKDVVLLPSYSEIKSRAQVDAGVEFLGRKFKSVAIPANMLCSISFELAEQLSESGHFYILHRFYEYYEILDWIYQNQDLALISISVGVNENDYNLIGAGVAKECARMILPLCTETTMYMAGSLRSWIHYIDLRAQQETQKEHREIAEGCKQIFIEQFPVLAEALEWK